MLYVNTEYTVNLYSLLFGPCAWPRNLNIWEYGFDSTLIFGMFQMIGSFACFSSISFHYKCYRLMCLRNHTNLSIYVEHHLNFNRNWSLDVRPKSNRFSTVHYIFSYLLLFFFFASSCSNKCDTEEYSIYDKTCARIVKSHVHRGSWGAEMNTVLRKPSWNRLVVSVFVCVCEREQTREMNKTNAIKTDFNIFACKWETSANR